MCSKFKLDFNSINFNLLNYVLKIQARVELHSSFKYIIALESCKISRGTEKFVFLIYKRKPAWKSWKDVIPRPLYGRRRKTVEGKKKKKRYLERLSRQANDLKR